QVREHRRDTHIACPKAGGEPVSVQCGGPGADLGGIDVGKTRRLTESAGRRRDRTVAFRECQSSRGVYSTRELHPSQETTGGEESDGSRVGRTAAPGYAGARDVTGIPIVPEEIDGASSGGGGTGVLDTIDDSGNLTCRSSGAVVDKDVRAAAADIHVRAGDDAKLNNGNIEHPPVALRTGG